MKLSEAFSYLDKNGGMQFLIDFYDIEHTLPLEDTIDTLTEICQKEKLLPYETLPMTKEQIRTYLIDTILNKTWTTSCRTTAATSASIRPIYDRAARAKSTTS